MEYRSHSYHTTLFRSSRSSLVISVNGHPIQSSNYFKTWQSSHEVRINGKLRKEEPLMLFVYRVLHDADPSIHEWKAELDEDGNPWGSIITKDDSGYLYNGNVLSVNTRPPHASPAYPKSANPSQSPILVCTYNCLYSRANDALCDWETETVKKSRKFGSRVVKTANLPWKVRSQRLSATIMADGAPDVLMLQEVTPRMLKSLLGITGLAGYDHTASSVGCCQSYDGYVHVLLNPEMFHTIGKATSVDEDYNCKQHEEVGDHQVYTRACIVRARHIPTGAVYIFSTCHLPASGDATCGVARIMAKIDKMKTSSDHVVVGGDFNVTSNPFKSLENVSGGQMTFANDGDMKLDWIVASPNVKAVGPSIVHSINPKKDRWPNDVEGSDHTALKVRVQPNDAGSAVPSGNAKAASSSASSSSLNVIDITDLTKQTVAFSNNTSGSMQIKGYSFVKPVYFCPASRVVSRQQKRQPTLLVSDHDWTQLKKPHATHDGAFGRDYWQVSVAVMKTAFPKLSGKWFAVWKFPGDLNHIPGYKKITNLPLPVGFYPFWSDGWWSPPTPVSISSLPMDDAVVEKMRVDFPHAGSVHFLEGNGVACAMIGTGYYIDGYRVEDVDTEPIARTLRALYHDCNISGFTCYGQHHAIVLYADVGYETPVLLTPQRLAAKLRTSARALITNALKLGTLPGHAKYIDSWADQYAAFFKTP